MLYNYSFTNWPHQTIKSVSPLISEHCPSFVNYWDQFIIPLTDYNEFVPFPPEWRNDTFPPLEGIGMSCFALMKSINFIFLSKENVKVADPFQHFKNTYFHFGLLFDIVETLARYILISQNELKIINFTEYLTLPQSEIRSDFEKWIIKYQKQIEDFRLKGTPIGFFPNRKKEILNLIIKDESELKSYKKFIQELKEYRNLFTHNPSVDIIRIGDEDYVVERKSSKLGKSWSDLKLLIDNGDVELIKPQILIANDLIKFLHLFESLVPHFERESLQVYLHNNFKILMHGYKR